MKKTNIIKGIASVMVAGSLASCSSDYLDLTPIGSVSAEEVAVQPTALRSGTFGVLQSMYRQYSDLYDYFWFNGEPWFNMVYGETLGQDFNNYFLASRTNNQMVNGRHMESNNTWGTSIPWRYLYGIIGQCNGYLALEQAAIDADEMRGEVAFRYAQLHAMRAYAYIRLQQVYGPRWQDAQNGEVESVVLRTEAPDAMAPTDKPLATTTQIMSQIYFDLDRAIELFEICEYDREFEWEINLPVAYGLYARAALLQDDYPTAQTMANKASEGFDIMSGKEYKKGFATPTSEWMWNSSGESTGMYYASFGASYACNGAYPIMWGNIGAGAIDMSLYTQVQNSNDVRCDLFFTPDKVSRAHRALFWNSDYCSMVSMNINMGEDLANDLDAFAFKRYEEVGNAGWVFPYCDGNDYYSLGKGIGGSTVILFGAQFKFWGTDFYGSSNYCFMRASEMKLIEAEAAVNNGDMTTAQNCLYDVNSKRIKNYTKSSKTGDDLLDEIKLYRRFELWGEGFSWFDFKRWNQPVQRIKWESGVMNSGNWPENYALTFEPDRFNGWRWPIPLAEIDYNTAIKINNEDE